MSTRSASWLLVCLVSAGPAFAQAVPPASPPSTQAGPAQPAEEPPAQPPTYEEQVVVSASRTEQRLVNAPATVSLLSSAAIENMPAQNYADLLRTVPGVNVTQTSARDINVTSRGATSTLSTSQLALMDGRSIYQDFFGFVAWDFLPINFDEVKQIEVIRGPASAVWGANAMTGVVNIITKSPREMEGGSVMVSAGTFDRTVPGRDEGAGSLFTVSASWAQAVDDRWAYKVSAGGMTMDPLPRPTGTLPNAFATPYPPFRNTGTTQPKFDGRVDYDFPDGRQKLVFSGGYAGTEGIIHTGIGPFDIQGGSGVGYGRVAYTRNAFRLGFFTNILNGDATNLLTVDARGNPILFSFENKTFDIDFGNVVTLGTRHVVSYGANFRRNDFDLSLAPRGSNRSEGGAYIQDEIFLSDRFRWLVGGRADGFDSIKGVVYSPRTTFMFKPAPAHTLRLSYNRAYRAPSLVNNYLEVLLANQIDLGLINPALRGVNYAFPVQAVGNPDLTEEEMTAYEVGYSGVLGNRFTVSAAFYVNDTKDGILFRQTGSYRASAPPPGWPLPPVVLELLVAQNAFGPGFGLPSTFSYENLGKVRDKGIELGIEGAVVEGITVYANYSWQAEPEPTGFDISDLNLPPTNRFNAGAGVTVGRVLGTVGVTYQDEAFWQDVLDARFNGATEGFTQVNASVGVKLAGEKAMATVKVNNLFNEAIQQHIFGDVLKRQVVGELRVRF